MKEKLIILTPEEMRPIQDKAEEILKLLPDDIEKALLIVTYLKTTIELATGIRSVGKMITKNEKKI